MGEAGCDQAGDDGGATVIGPTALGVMGLDVGVPSLPANPLPPCCAFGSIVDSAARPGARTTLWVRSGVLLRPGGAGGAAIAGSTQTVVGRRVRERASCGWA